MSKKRSQDNIEYYRRKIQELEDQQKSKRRRIIIESSSDDDEATMSASPTPDAECNVAFAQPGNSSEIGSPAADISNPKDGGEVDVDPELSLEVLSALGDETACSPKFGVKIHHSLAQRWEPILKKGLPKEAKEKLIKEHLVPENCQLLQAPKLNGEVAAAISETARQRDKRKEAEQQQLGVGISAINKALTLLLTSSADSNIEAIKLISDGCRILTDLHHQETQARISVINYALAKPFLNIVQDSERDETLYGNRLPEKIKASKAIEKQGLSIKKFVKTTKTGSTAEQTAPPISTRPYQFRQSSSYQGNWSGPRFQQNRGGRRGPSRTKASMNHRSPAQQTMSAAGLSNQRAPPRAPATRR